MTGDWCLATALLFLLAYTWVGYALLLWLVRRFFARPAARAAIFPRVSLILPVHNEQERIGAKLEDCLRLDYPEGQLEILIVSDGSSDATDAIAGAFAKRDPRIHLLRTAGRAGKSGAQNLAIAQAKGDVLFLTDASVRTRPDTLKELVVHFADPQVGMVAGTVAFGEPDDAIARGQGLYWRFELFLRQMESDLGILATASGSGLAMRRSLFRPLPPTYGDDCILPYDVRLQGYRVVHEAHALLFDTMPHTIAGELKTRARMTLRNWAGTLSRAALLNPLRFPGTALALISHKLLRWLTPFILFGLFLASAAVALRGGPASPWALQAAFYIAALIGWRLTRAGRPAWVFGLPFAFCLANVGFFLGLLKALRGETIVAYQSGGSKGHAANECSGRR